VNLPADIPPAVKKTIDDAERALHELSKLVLESRKPTPGAYGFFHYSAHTLTRLRDCGRILARLYKQRAALTRANIAQEQKRVELQLDAKPAGTPYPAEFSAVTSVSHELTQYMQLDLETLYIFGMTLLDQWSLQAFAIGGMSGRRQHPFVELVVHLEKETNSPLSPLWKRLKSQFLWLHYQLRFYRNRFIVHPTRPWQRGTTASVYGDDFNLFIPTPPGWLDDRQLDEEIHALINLAPRRIRDAPSDYWEKARAGRLIEVLFDNIADLQPTDREKVAELFGKKGGSTPSFQIIGNRLMEFVLLGSEILKDVANSNMADVDLGSPHKKKNREKW
jgi:hypothetical protein